MGRLTKTDIESIKNTLEKLRTETMNTHGRISLIDDENIYEAINAVEKLAHYEDLEEQGRLTEVVKCKDCKHERYCEQAQYLGEDGYCSKAELERSE